MSTNQVKQRKSIEAKSSIWYTEIKNLQSHEYIKADFLKNKSINLKIKNKNDRCSLREREKHVYNRPQNKETKLQNH